MDLLIFLLSFFSGGLGAWLFFKQRYVSSQEYNELDKQYFLLKNQYKSLSDEHENIKSTFLSLQRTERDLAENLLLSRQETQQLKEKLKSQEKDLEQIHFKMQDQFELLAQNILQKNSENIARINQEKIGSILDPLRTKIESFEKKVEETHLRQASESSVLKHEIKRLAELNFQISEDAKNLTQALKGDNKAQGNWGEIVLERILENSGLNNGSEYILQGRGLGLKDDEGDMLKPDVIILLPDEKHIIIDSKVSLKAYDSYVACQSEEEKINHLKLHVNSIKSHVKILSEKHYHSLGPLKTPDFVLLFLPIEACFSISFQAANFDLFGYAWEKKVVIVSPTTLLATLRTVASIWKYEKQNSNAMQIAEESGKLYDKFFAFVEDLEKIGKGIKNSQSAYDEATKKLLYGKGNIISRAEKLKSMGVNTKKSLGDLLSKGIIKKEIVLGGEENKQED